MHIEDKVAEGLVGRTVEFDIQELIAVKDKWANIMFKVESAKADKMTRVRCDLKDLEHMNVLMGDILGEIKSSEEVHNHLFVRVENHQELA
jgi:hypothetical protein